MFLQAISGYMCDPSRSRFTLHCIYVMSNMVKSVFLPKNWVTNRRKKKKIILARICVIDTDNHNYNAILTRISARQEGLCRFCAQRIKDKDIIISTAHSRRRKYFHKECAKKI